MEIKELFGTELITVNDIIIGFKKEDGTIDLFGWVARAIERAWKKPETELEEEWKNWK